MASMLSMNAFKWSHFSSVSNCMAFAQRGNQKVDLVATNATCYEHRFGGCFGNGPRGTSLVLGSYENVNDDGTLVLAQRIGPLSADGDVAIFTYWQNAFNLERLLQPGFIVLTRSSMAIDLHEMRISTDVLYPHHTFITPSAGAPPLPYHVHECVLYGRCPEFSAVLGTGVFDVDENNLPDTAYARNFSRVSSRKFVEYPLTVSSHVLDLREATNISTSFFLQIAISGYPSATSEDAFSTHYVLQPSSPLLFSFLVICPDKERFFWYTARMPFDGDLEWFGAHVHAHNFPHQALDLFGAEPRRIELNLFMPQHAWTTLPTSEVGFLNNFALRTQLYIKYGNLRICAVATGMADNRHLPEATCSKWSFQRGDTMTVVAFFGVQSSAAAWDCSMLTASDSSMLEGGPIQHTMALTYYRAKDERIHYTSALSSQRLDIYDASLSRMDSLRLLLFGSEQRALTLQEHTIISFVCVSSIWAESPISVLAAVAFFFASCTVVPFWFGRACYRETLIPTYVTGAAVSAALLMCLPVGPLLYMMFLPSLHLFVGNPPDRELLRRARVQGAADSYLVMLDLLLVLPVLTGAMLFSYRVWSKYPPLV